VKIASKKNAARFGYTKCERKGRGGWSTVFKCFEEKTQTWKAMKLAHRVNDLTMENAYNHFLHRKFDEYRVPQKYRELFQKLDGPEELWQRGILISDWLGDKDLSQLRLSYVEECGGNISEFMNHIGTNLFLMVSVLKMLGIENRDFKSDNLIIDTSDANPNNWKITMIDIAIVNFDMQPNCKQYGYGFDFDNVIWPPCWVANRGYSGPDLGLACTVLKIESDEVKQWEFNIREVNAKNMVYPAGIILCDLIVGRPFYNKNCCLSGRIENGDYHYTYNSGFLSTMHKTLINSDNYKKYQKDLKVLVSGIIGHPVYVPGQDREEFTKGGYLAASVRHRLDPADILFNHFKYEIPSEYFWTYAKFWKNDLFAKDALAKKHAFLRYLKP